MPTSYQLLQAERAKREQERRARRIRQWFAYEGSRQGIQNRLDWLLEQLASQRNSPWFETKLFVNPEEVKSLKRQLFVLDHPEAKFWLRGAKREEARRGILRIRFEDDWEMLFVMKA